MRISVGSDHGGFGQKKKIVEALESKGYGIIDRGCDDDSSVDYPDYAALVANDVVVGEAEFGILVCGTGIGMSIAANKVDGIRAANVTSPEFAHLAREHNDANILALSGRFVDLDQNLKIIDEFINTPFAGDRHLRRVEKIMALEQ